MKHIFIGVPTFKDVSVEFLVCLVSLVQRASETYTISFGVSTRTHRNLAREQLIEQAKTVQADYLLFLDDDMLFPPDTIDRLIAHDVPIVSALAFSRKGPHFPCILLVKYSQTENGISEQYEPYFDYPKDQLVEVAATGLACTLIKREVLEGIDGPYCTSKEGAGEDVEFMRKAGQKGYQCYADTSLKIGHLSDRLVISEATYLAQERN